MQPEAILSVANYADLGYTEWEWGENMRILLINGSPKGVRSNTYRLAKAFLEGMGEGEPRELTTCRMDIQPCRGCFACWSKTPGQCVLGDDMASVIESILWADVILWSFPLYYFSVPGGLKNLIDRQLPMNLPFMESASRFGGHPGRYDLSGKRHVVISTCGFYTARGNYDGVTAMFDHMLGKGNYTSIFCGQGELFRVKELAERTEEYLSYMRQAGWEFIRDGISRETYEKLSQLLYPREVFEAMADASWGVEKTGQTSPQWLTFTRQMGALYNPKAWPGKDLVLEMCYTDVDGCCQLVLTETGCRVLTDDFLPYTTRIETPFSVWNAIAAGEITGEEALARQQYRVKGDFSLMLHWDDYFGPEKARTTAGTKKCATNMNILLLPWIVFWVAAPMDAFYGAVISAGVCALIPLGFYKNRKTIYDVLSAALVTGCALALLLSAPVRTVLPLSYFAFGLMWSVSCFLKIPLTAHYSMNDYNGEQALNNPLFIKTNRILTGCWGVLYLLTPIWTYYWMGTALASWTGAVNSVLPALMGLFTVWFQKWYPARIARG